MSKRDISATSRVSEEGAPFIADPDDDIPEADDSFFEHARIRRGDVIIREATGTLTRRGRPPKPDGERKVLVSLRLAPDIVTWFRATGPGWQSRIEALLRREIGAGSSAPSGEVAED
jgi:uncharacterized protein (DUF4415 family)